MFVCNYLHWPASRMDLTLIKEFAVSKLDIFCWQCVWILHVFSFFLLSFIKPNSPSLERTLGVVVRGCVFRSGKFTKASLSKQKWQKPQRRKAGLWEQSPSCVQWNLLSREIPTPLASRILGNPAWVLDSLFFWNWWEGTHISFCLLSVELPSIYLNFKSSDHPFGRDSWANSVLKGWVTCPESGDKWWACHQTHSGLPRQPRFFPLLLMLVIQRRVSHRVGPRLRGHREFPICSLIRRPWFTPNHSVRQMFPF